MHSLKAWREQNKLRLQAATLAALIGLSFGLYWALRVGQHTLAAVIFAIIALCMAFVIWIA